MLILLLELMVKSKDANFLYQIAKLYYKERYTQEEIAQLVNFSRQKVQRLLNQAVEEGIVQINVINPEASYEELEKKLENKYGLLKALVVSGVIQSDKLISQNIGRSASKYIEEILHDNEFIGIGWGSTVYDTINYFNPRNKFKVTAIPLIGGAGHIYADFQVNDLARKFAEKSGGMYLPLYAPALLDSEKTAKQLLMENNIKKVIDFWDKLDIAIIGIGKAILKDSSIPDFYYSDIPLHSIMKNNEVAGEILIHYFLNDGTLFNPAFDKRIIGISLEQLKRVKKVIGVAGSLWKKDIILTAIKGGYINILVTDDVTAEALINN